MNHKTKFNGVYIQPRIKIISRYKYVLISSGRKINLFVFSLIFVGLDVYVPIVSEAAAQKVNYP